MNPKKKYLTVIIKMHGKKIHNDVREKISLQKVSYIDDLELYHVIL